MTIQTYSYSEEEEDQRIYQELKSWSPDTFPQGHMLPKLGVIAYDDLGTAVCFVCADMSNNVPRAFLDFLQTNPNASPTARFKGIKLAEEFLCRELKRLGYVLIDAITRFAGMASLSQRLGYQVNPTAVIHLYKQIQ